MNKLGAIDWDATTAGFQYKLGYCQCGAKILATGEELAEIVEEFGSLSTRKGRIIKRVAEFLLRQLA